MKQPLPIPPPNKSAPRPISRQQPPRCKIKTTRISPRPNPHARSESISLLAKSARKLYRRKIALKSRKWHRLSLRLIRQFMDRSNLISSLGLLLIRKVAQASSIAITTTQAVVNSPRSSQHQWRTRHPPQSSYTRPTRFSRNADRDKVWPIPTREAVRSTWKISFSITRQLDHPRILPIRHSARGLT